MSYLSSSNPNKPNDLYKTDKCKLKKEELLRLLAQAQTGNPLSKKSAAECILQQNINLVHSIVNRYTHRGHERDDLFQMGCIGLYKAIQNFDKSYDVEFSTYAVPMIIGEIKRFIRDDNPTKISRSLKELSQRILRFQEQLTGVLGREPTINQLAAAMSLEPQEIIAALESAQTEISLNEPAFPGDTGKEQVELLERIPSHKDIINIDHFAVRQVLKQLPPKERQIIILRFFADKTQREIADLFGLSQVHISRIEKQALKIIKESLSDNSGNQL